MTRNPVAITPETSVGEAAHLMRTEGIRHVLVVDGDVLVGIASNRDIRGHTLDQPGDASPRRWPEPSASRVPRPRRDDRARARPTRRETPR
jgi:CBS domain-containing protein